ncbi:sugar ABC transporter permease [bacterium]|nr:sugar ABC transporter permease [bacterium]
MRKVKKWWIPWLFLTPALVILGTFVLYPMFFGSVLAFFDFSLLSYDEGGSLLPPRWVGLANFRRLFSDIYFIKAMQNSILYVLVVPILQAIAIFLAWLLNEDTSFSKLSRTALYIPVVTSMVVVGIVWKWLLRTDGLLNQIIAFVSFDKVAPIPWLTDTKIAIFSVMLVTMWQGIGYYLILYLAGLQAIPKEIEEQAQIDGAQSWQIFRKIILPLLKPTIAVCSLLSLISALKVFTEIYIITGGGPQNSTLTSSFYIYQNAFENFDMGYAASMALVLAAVIGVATLGQRFMFAEKA